MPRLVRWLPGVLVAASALAGDVEPGARETSLLVGRGWALVRELRTVSLGEGVDEFDLAGIPAEADLSSLVVRSRRFPAELLEWQWVPEDAKDAARAPSGISMSDGAAIWRPRESRAPASRPGGVVRCRLSSPSAVPRLGVDVIYVVRGPDWSAHYQVALRGEQAGDTEPVSVDLAGFVRLRNPCSAAFSNATVRLVGRQEPPDAIRRKDPGFPMVDPDSPLAGLWLQEAPAPAPEYDYVLPERIALGPGESADVVLVQTERTPASRVYRLDADEIPAGPKNAPLRKWIVFSIAPAGRRGAALPPGPVTIFLGGQRTRLLQHAWFAHTPVGGELRMDLGPADDVVGSRLSRGRGAAVVGYFEEVFALRVLNRRPSDVLVEMDEKPPVNLEWDVVSATKPYVQSGRRLLFRARVAGGVEDVTEYRLRIRRPRL